ncbi:ACP S-malonyltransferase [Brytella acorum]|uniref:Malonyl CoA-acyl carrier protein transacylase n=1 Tax=Brytella acorum TaxID=2959299 RepID=A0AA35UH64_9PROT|nr:ACP S-malonyltransferase [Brytella acorum]CAI9119964.1 ACP S-malonyltransferase [Brytella acorum]
MAVRAFVFPGQGSQSVGMGLALYEAFGVAREVFQEVDDALSFKLSEIIFRGEPAILTSTENAQPALMAVSMATLRVLEHEGGFKIQDRAALVAGHSLGEYSALAAAGSFGVAQAARLLRLRGQAMQRAVPAGEGGMAALMGVDLDQAQDICDAAAVVQVEGQADRHEVIEVANDNGGGQVVISGVMSAIERAVLISRERKVKRAVVLPVSAPFHCSLMKPAADEMAEALASAEIAAPVVPLVANVTAAKVTSPDEIRSLLVRQVTGSVLWRETILAMAAMGIDTVVELGSGKVLSGLVRRIDGDIATASAGTPDEIEALLKTF